MIRGRSTQLLPQHQGGVHAERPYAGPHWYVACTSRELRRNAISAVTIAGTPIALFRDPEGAPHALEDRCLHRNAPLSMGKMCASGVSCAYHGWRYGFDGKLLEVPALDASCTPQEARVRAFPCVECDDYVWVCLEQQPSSARPLPFPHFGERGWTSFRMQTRFATSVEACLENFLDCPHAVFVHHRWFRARQAAPVRAVVRALPDGAEAEYFEEPRSGSVVWRALFLERGTMRHTDRFIAPATSRVDYESRGLHYVITSSCTPVHATETIVHTVITFRVPFGAGPLVRLYFEPLARIIIGQDRRMLDAVQHNIDRFGGPALRSTPADLLLRSIVAWRNALEAGIPTPVAGREEGVVIRL